MGNEQMQAAKKALQDSMAILAHIEPTQRLNHQPAQPSIRSEELRRRIDKNLAEITEKLNRLIGPQ
jgi:hypothetical protein